MYTGCCGCSPCLKRPRQLPVVGESRVPPHRAVPCVAVLTKLLRRQRGSALVTHRRRLQCCTWGWALAHGGDSHTLLAAHPVLKPKETKFNSQAADLKLLAAGLHGLGKSRKLGVRDEVEIQRVR
jgi:hypothetical protein